MDLKLPTPDSERPTSTRWAGIVARVLGVVVLSAASAWAQAESTLGTIGAGVPNQSSVPGPRWTPPSGPAPRMANGKPDLSGVWDHPYVPDMSATNKANPALQTGAGEVPYSEAGLANIKAYDPEHNGDYTGMCMPFGFMRSVNSPYPLQIMQNDL